MHCDLSRRRGIFEKSIIVAVGWILIIASLVAPGMATPPQEVVEEVTHRANVRKKANDGDFTAALKLLTTEGPGQSLRVQTHQLAYAVARASELLIFLESKTYFEEYMPVLEPLRDRLEKADRTHPKIDVLCKEAISAHDRAKSVYTNIDKPGPDIEAIKERIAIFKADDKTEAEALFDEIAKVQPDSLASQLAANFVARLPEYRGLHLKYHKVFALDRLVAKHAATNPVRARNLGKMLKGLLEDNRFQAKQELTSKNVLAQFAEAIFRANRAINTTFWHTYESPPAVDLSVQKELIKLVERFAHHHENGELEKAIGLIHPDSPLKPSIAKTLEKREADKIRYSEFRSFRFDGKRVLVACTMEVTLKGAGKPGEPRQQTIVFEKHDDEWRISSP